MTHELTLFFINCHKYMQLVLVKGVLLLRHSSKRSILIQQSKDLVKAVTRIYFILLFYFVCLIFPWNFGGVQTPKTPPSYGLGIGLLTARIAVVPKLTENDYGCKFGKPNRKSLVQTTGIWTKNSEWKWCFAMRSTFTAGTVDGQKCVIKCSRLAYLMRVCRHGNDETVPMLYL